MATTLEKRLRPMRGSIAERDKLVFPYMATPKLDGVRCFIDNRTAYTKSGKAFGNKWIQRNLTLKASGVDGELICGDPRDPHAFRRTTSEVRTIEGIPTDLKFYVFDLRPRGETALDLIASDRWTRTLTWYNRWMAHKKDAILRRKPVRPTPGDSTWWREQPMGECKTPAAIRIIPVQPTWVWRMSELDAFEEKCLAEGYEGVMLRNPNSLYKFGQATVRENALLKLKRFSDGEAKIIGFVEFNYNDNVAFTDAQGFTKRSSSKSGKRPAGKLGKFVVEGTNGVYAGKVFEVGSGYTNGEREDFWLRRNEMLGETLTYRHQTFTGGYDLPRLPTFEGLRMPEDLSP